MLGAGAAVGQGMQIGFGGSDFDDTAPVEIRAGRLALDQAKGTALFSGDVLVRQGTLRLAAGSIEVSYAQDANGGAGKVRRIVARGGVTLVRGPDAAEAETALYDVVAATVRMEGGVLITQGPTAIEGDALSLDLGSGAARIEGRVRSVIQPKAAP